MPLQYRWTLAGMSPDGRWNAVGMSWESPTYAENERRENHMFKCLAGDLLQLWRVCGMLEIVVEGQFEIGGIIVFVLSLRETRYTAKYAIRSPFVATSKASSAVLLYHPSTAVSEDCNTVHVLRMYVIMLRLFTSSRSVALRTQPYPSNPGCISWSMLSNSSGRLFFRHYLFPFEAPNEKMLWCVVETRAVTTLL